MAMRNDRQIKAEWTGWRWQPADNLSEIHIT